jgi:hypothetical protein
MLDLEWDVTARNLNAIGRWTSPVEGRRNVYLRLLSHLGAVQQSLDWKVGKSGSRSGRSGRARSDLTARFQDNGLPKEVFGCPAGKRSARAWSQGFEPFRLGGVREAMVVLK